MVEVGVEEPQNAGGMSARQRPTDSACVEAVQVNPVGQQEFATPHLAATSAVMAESHVAEASAVEGSAAESAAAESIARAAAADRSAVATAKLQVSHTFLAEAEAVLQAALAAAGPRGAEALEQVIIVLELRYAHTIWPGPWLGSMAQQQGRHDYLCVE